MIEMRKKRKPAEYKNVNKGVLALPDDDRYSFKNVKEWIKETKDQISTLNKQSRGRISKLVIGSVCFLENMKSIESFQNV
jgi:hypothetical protein